MSLRVDAVLIAGPTASGKSRAALDLASKADGAVINADSMQIYREAPILTAQPASADLERAPHLLYGHVSAREPYSVGQYARDAAKALSEVNALGRLPIFVGGTGLYFSALTDGIADIPPIAAEVRERARDRLKRIGVAALHAELAARDPATAGRLRPTDPQRVLRAVEVLDATGRPLSSWQKEASAPVLEGLRLAKFVIDVSREDLRARIERRFRTMIDEGALAEAEALERLDPALPAAKILGLRELQALRRGERSKDEAIESAVIATRQFAKRQATWFRGRMKDWRWISDSNEILRSPDWSSEPG